MTERRKRRLGWNRVAPYVAGMVFPFLVMFVGVPVILDVLAGPVRLIGLWFGWISVMAFGLVCSARSLWLAPNFSIELIGAVFLCVYVFVTLIGTGILAFISW